MRRPRRKPKLKPETGGEAAQARATALDLLARREHGERELARKLAARGYDHELVEATLAMLVAQGLLSNSRYVDSYVESRVQRGHGPLKIRAELRERGIEDGLIDARLADYMSHWPELLEQARAKKFGPDQPCDFRERSRQMRFLQQRGFTGEQIDAAFRRRD
jgi:regulatory protein